MARSFRIPGRINITVDRGDRHAVQQADGQPGGLRFLDPPPAFTVSQRSPRGAVRFLEPPDEDPEWTEIEGHYWYHTIELPDGTTTPGAFDHREISKRIGFPSDMSGMRALDIATFDGFWAYEMESRGAEVTALDIGTSDDLDLPRRARREADVPRGSFGRGFEFTHKARKSSVTKVIGSVYDLDPDVIGTFDFVHIADLLVHLRRPLDALEAVRSVTRREALIVDAIDPSISRGRHGPLVQYIGGWEDVVWWVPSLDGLAQMIIDAGFSDLRVNVVYELAKTDDPRGYWRASITATV
jgi:tRNA (mo5U34)-methyltransferase